MLTGKKILMFIDDLFEDLELLYPRLRMIEEGAEVVVAGPEESRTYKGKNGYPATSDISFDQVNPTDYDALIISGGFAPDKLRRDVRVLEITRKIFENGKAVGHICHAGWIPISAKIVKGYKCTSTPGIKDDLENAGAIWSDAPVVVDRNMISSRRPDDLPYFCKAIKQYILDNSK